jgi:IS1 family transposase
LPTIPTPSQSRPNAFIAKALAERNSLRSICRIFNVSLNWLISFARQLWQQVPQDVAADLKQEVKRKPLKVKLVQLDELWTFVGNKQQKRFVFVALQANTRQVLAYQIGKRYEATVRQLYNKLRGGIKSNAWFYTDHLPAFKAALPVKDMKRAKRTPT